MMTKKLWTQICLAATIGIGANFAQAAAPEFDMSCQGLRSTYHLKIQENQQGQKYFDTSLVINFGNNQVFSSNIESTNLTKEEAEQIQKGQIAKLASIDYTLSDKNGASLRRSVMTEIRRAGGKTSVSILTDGMTYEVLECRESSRLERFKHSGGLVPGY